jgi:hypothetical protein
LPPYFSTEATFGVGREEPTMGNSWPGLDALDVTVEVELVERGLVVDDRAAGDPVPPGAKIRVTMNFCRVRSAMRRVTRVGC